MKSRRNPTARITRIALASAGVLASVVASPQALAAARASGKAPMSSYACGADVVFHSTALTSAKAAVLCAKLDKTRNEFNDVFNGGQPMTNAAGDLTTVVDFYVFKDNADYVEASKQFKFSASSSDPDSNAGIMYERDPLKPGNHALVAARAFDNDMTDITNLQHEFVHYLTFRYLAPGDLDLPLWLTEGLAENLGNPQEFDAARQITLDNGYTLSEILENTDDSDGDLVYNAGHLAVEYLLVSRPIETASLFDAIDQNDPDAIDEWAETIGTRLDRNFANWLAKYGA